MLSAAQVTLHCFGTTTGGSPRHPLYLPGNAQLTAMADREAGALPTSQPQSESRSPLR